MLDFNQIIILSVLKLQLSLVHWLAGLHPCFVCTEIFVVFIWGPEDIYSRGCLLASAGPHKMKYNISISCNLHLKKSRCHEAGKFLARFVYTQLPALEVLQ